MIAPLRDPESSCDENAASSLAVARRAVAAMLFSSTSRALEGCRTSPWAAWAFLIWVVLVAITYLVLVGVWAVAPS